MSYLDLFGLQIVHSWQLLSWNNTGNNNKNNYIQCFVTLFSIKLGKTTTRASYSVFWRCMIPTLLLHVLDACRVQQKPFLGDCMLQPILMCLFILNTLSLSPAAGAWSNHFDDETDCNKFSEVDISWFYSVRMRQICRETALLCLSYLAQILT